MMKRLVLAGILALVLTGCSGASATANKGDVEEAQTRIIASIEEVCG